MKRAALLFGFALFTATLSAQSQPAKDETKVKFYCPVAGMPEAKSCCCPGGYCPRQPSPRHTIDYKGGKIQLCCSLCDKLMKETPAKFAAVANHQLVATNQAAQIACPNCGEAYTATQVTAEVAGVKVMFCKENCRDHVVNSNTMDRVEMVFGDKAFARGFVVRSKK